MVFFCTYRAVSAPQALYKLYNVAANHRHLYHHAFPGPQVDEDGEEQDKKRDWLDRDKNTAGTSWWWTGGGGRRRNILTHQALSFILVLALPHQYSHYFKANNGTV